MELLICTVFSGLAGCSLIYYLYKLDSNKKIQLDEQIAKDKDKKLKELIYFEVKTIVDPLFISHNKKIIEMINSECEQTFNSFSKSLKRYQPPETTEYKEQQKFWFSLFLAQQNRNKSKDE